MLPDADILYACDRRWWDVHLKGVKSTFKGQLYTQHEKPQDIEYARQHGITAVKGAHQNGLGREVLHYGSNSGYQAINLAYLLGATRIILLGYDMSNTNGKAHWFGSHPAGLCNGNYPEFIPKFTRLAADLASEGVQVVNCSRTTALTQFDRKTLEEIQWAT